ncbi:hypothetical protein ABL78_8526 [Leptomonas seymouri]|uniref:Lipoprotein n=1 Tax=Leptomonas seymouri TaxID=5684 RepID=A0A0N1P9L8_LEPSE|nr:hypothetical protein ABL78_8526 [Leptomonas seymouri]|eukprot:KPI82464.1 hypothetical protein ABL78_8526 [Leptomonas seymouri]
MQFRAARANVSTICWISAQLIAWISCANGCATPSRHHAAMHVSASAGIGSADAPTGTRPAPARFAATVARPPW